MHERLGLLLCAGEEIRRRGDTWAHPHSLLPGPSVSVSFSPVMRSYTASTSVIAVSKCVVGSKDSVMKTLSCIPFDFGANMSYVS